MYFGYGIRNSSGGLMDSEKRQLNNGTTSSGPGNSGAIGSYVNSGFDVQSPGTQTTTTTIVVTTHSNIVQ